MYPIEPHNIFAVEFPMFSAPSFPTPTVITNFAIPKSETRAVMSSLRRTLLGFRSITVVDLSKDGGIVKKILEKGERDASPGDLDEVLGTFNAAYY